MLLSSSGAMPRRVALERISLSAISFLSNSVSAKSFKVILILGTAWRMASKLASARGQKASFKLNTAISRTPSKAHWIIMAEATPPAPTKVIFLSFTETPPAFKFNVYPAPSVICPVRTPSSLTMVLTAPIALAAGESLSRNGMTAFFNGIVTLAPRKFRSFSELMAFSVFSSVTSKAK